MTTLKSNVSNTFNSLQSDVSNTMNNLKANIESAWSNLRNNLESNNNGIKSSITTAWNTLQTDVTRAARDLKNDVDTAFGNLKTNVSKSWNDLKSDSSSVWNTIVSNIKKAVGDIKTAVSNTTLSFGSIKIPTFKWNGTTDAKEGTVAKLTVGSTTVSNYAGAMASGVILDRPTLFGMMDGNLLRAGEAGKEVVIGANSLSSMIRQSATNTALNADVANILGLLAQYLPETANQNVVLDSGKLVGALSPALNRQFGMMIRG
jgi:phage-related minor tail protein